MKTKKDKKPVKEVRQFDPKKDHSSSFKNHGVAPSMPPPFTPKEQKALGPFYW